jgi:hypothetical protein
MFRLERWSAGTLFGSWVVWWAALIGVTIGPGLLRATQVIRRPGTHGTASASFENSHLLFKVVDGTSPTGMWTFSTSFGAALAWMAIPPLALWLLWLMSRPRRTSLPSPAAPLIAEPDADIQAMHQRPNAERAPRT